MQAIGRMKSIETMERITRQKFCDNFDEILDRVDKEDIGFVILDNEGKDGHVLCPARWLQINFNIAPTTTPEEDLKDILG